MRKRRGVTKSTMIASAVVVMIVALVLSLLYLSYLPSNSPTTTDQQISVQDATLFSGSPSKQSFNSTCSGDAILSLQMYNPTSSDVHITNVSLSGSTIKGNATVLAGLSNSCLSISLSVPTLGPNSTYDFLGWSDVPLQLGQEYSYSILLDNGQWINQSLLAQSE